MVFRDLIFNAKVVEQRFGTGVLSHHNPQASVNGDEKEHRQNACSYRRCCQHFSSHFTKTFSTATPVLDIYLMLIVLINAFYQHISASSIPLTLFLFLSHTFPQLCRPVVFSGGRCTAILGLLSLSKKGVCLKLKLGSIGLERHKDFHVPHFGAGHSVSLLKIPVLSLFQTS
jgi:hypothetical protein